LSRDRFVLGATVTFGCNTTLQSSARDLDRSKNRNKHIMKNNNSITQSGVIALVGLIMAAGASHGYESLGATTTIAPYMQSSVYNVTSIRSVADSTSFGLPQMVGIPDGLGAYDNFDGTFTVLMNHELGSTAGDVRAHGAIGSFVSKMVIQKSDFAVLSHTDLMQNYASWNTGSGSFNAPVTGAAATFGRFCSADLPKQSAFQYGNLGTANKIFMTGEEVGPEGRAVGHVVTGANAGTAYQLPHLGRFSWENSVASPHAQAKTIVMGMDDTPNNGQVYMYVGNKQSTGNDVQKAGLVGGGLYTVQLNVADSPVATTESTANGGQLNGRFSFYSHGDVSGQTGDQINTDSIFGLGINFARPEDGAFDPNNKNDFYFVTTATSTSNSRLYRMRFDDIENPLLGGDLTALLIGNEGHVMFDNMTVTEDGRILLQEDPGGNNRFSKIWDYNIGTGAFTQIADFKPGLFGPTLGAIFNNDEESSGIIDISHILGREAYLLDAQVHTAATGFPGGVEHAQLLVLQVPEPATGALGILGAVVLALRRRRASR
jgi:hypothetical protein